MSVLNPGRNLVLIGLMGTGKTSVGQALAARLQRPFVDTDERVEHHSGRTIADIFDTDGERAFRRLEAEAVRQVSATRGQVIAVGGGAVLDPSNVTVLRGTGDLVLLEADAEEMARRVGDPASRPLLGGGQDLAERLEQLHRQRADTYRTVASHTVNSTGRDPEDIASEILAWAATRPGLLAREEREAAP